MMITRVFTIGIPLLLFCLLKIDSKGQDSSTVLSFKNFYELVLQNHPLVKQAYLLNDQAKSELRVARAGFDPKFDFDLNRKVFKNTTYFNYFDNGLKVPLWFGSDIKAGFERNTGLLVNPVNFTPPEGLWYIGLEVPIGRGMVMDERRAVVRQAIHAQEIAEAERVKWINKVLLQAAKDYWEWYYQYNRYKGVQEGYQLAKIRYEGIVQRVIQGDLASIDTIEASIVMQERLLETQHALNDFTNTGIVLSNYLWNEDQLPLEIDNSVPESPSIDSKITPALIEKLNQYAAINHPELIKITYKIKQLELDRKLTLNNLYPNMSFGAKYLSTPERNLINDLNYDYVRNNYKITFNLSQPIFIRKERGKYQLSKIKLINALYEQKLIDREINNSVITAYNDVILFEQMIKTQEVIFTNTKTLVNGEQSKFNSGESSLFLLNSRESKMIDSQVKLLELKAKLEKSKALLYWTAGTFSF